MPDKASRAATDVPSTPAPITTQRRDLTKAIAPTVDASHEAGKSPVRADLAMVAAEVVARYAGSNMRLDAG